MASTPISTRATGNLSRMAARPIATDCPVLAMFEASLRLSGVRGSGERSMGKTFKIAASPAAEISTLKERIPDHLHDRPPVRHVGTYRIHFETTVRPIGLA
ncbi:hypothetical protein PSAC2689_200129 [Paraburkholderia sacchari]